MSRRAGSTAKPDLSVPADELAIERELWRGALASRGIAARAVGSPELGLELLRKSTESFPMLLVGGAPMSDLQPLIREFRNNNPSGEVVFCADDETELDADEGSITTLLKPFTLPELLQVVEARLAAVAPGSGEDAAGRDA